MCAIARGDLERLDRRQDDDDDQQNCRYLIDNTKEFLGMSVPVETEFIYPMGK